MEDKLKKKVVDVKTAANILGVSNKTIYNWFYNGSLPGIKLPGGGWRVSIIELARILGIREEELVGEL